MEVVGFFEVFEVVVGFFDEDLLSETSAFFLVLEIVTLAPDLVVDLDELLEDFAELDLEDIVFLATDATFLDELLIFVAALATFFAGDPPISRQLDTLPRAS